MESEVQQSSRLAPESSWSVFTEAPLSGFGLAREAGLIVAWDEGHQLYIYDLAGECRATSRAAGKVVAGVFSDDGSRIVLLVEGSKLLFLDQDLGVVAERQGPPDSVALTIDPHGRYTAVASRSGLTQFFNRHGKVAGRLETVQGLAHLGFVPDRPTLIAAAPHGLMMAFELSFGSGEKLDAEPIWQERQVSNVGRLAMTGDGSMILASCFNHGVQRFDLNGNNDGSYHLGGTATHAVPDFAGRIIAVATLEGDLVLLNSGGNVRWRTELARPVVALETDPLGRYLIYGHNTGEIVRLDLYGRSDSSRAKVAAPVSNSRSDSKAGSRVNSSHSANSAVRPPAWSHSVAANDDQAETAIVSVLDQPGRVAVLSNSLRLQLFDQQGKALGYAPSVVGVGRIIRTAPGWIAAATDRSVVLYQANKNEAQRIDVSLVEVTHLAIRPDSFGLGVVQERDRIGRATVAGRWIWKRELSTPVEDIAIGLEGDFAISTDSGKLIVFDAAGQENENFQLDGSESLSLIEAVDKAPQELAWITLARRSQVLRGHDRRGKVLWQSPTMFEAWQFAKLGTLALVIAADGRVQAFDGTGHLIEQSKPSSGTRDHFAISESGKIRRISTQGVHLICADLQGRVIWRTVCDATIGPMAVSSSGVAAMIGRSLAWFPGIE